MTDATNPQQMNRIRVGVTVARDGEEIYQHTETVPTDGSYERSLTVIGELCREAWGKTMGGVTTVTLEFVP